MLGGAIDTLRIVYQVDVADRGTKPLLASERAVQREVTRTSAVLRAQDAQARRSSAISTSTSTRRAAGLARETSAVRTASAALSTKTRGELSSARATAAAAAASKSAVTQVERQTAATRRLTVAQRAQAVAARVSARASAASAATGAASATAGGSRVVTAPRGGPKAGVAGAGAGMVGRAARTGPIGAAVGLGVALAQTIKFDRAMRNVNSIAQLNETQFKALGKSVRGLAGETAQAPKTLAEGLYDLVSSGFDSKQSMTILRQSAKAATAGLTDTATSTKAVAAVLNAYHLPASAAANVSDVLFKTVDRGVISFEQLSGSIGDVLPFASSLGVGLDQVGASVSTMTKAGIGPEETMTRIKNVMVSILKPSKGLSAALRETGASSGEALIKQKGFQGALEALVGTTDGSKAAVAKLFPNIRSLGGALALTGKNAKGARADLASFRDATGATDLALKEQSKSVSYQWNKLKAEASSLAISVGSKLVPALVVVVGAMSKVARGKGPLGGIAKGAVTAGKQLLDAFKPAMPFFQNVLLPVLGGIAKGVLGGIVVAFKIAVPVIKVVATVLGLIGKAAKPLKPVFSAIGAVIGFFLGGPLLKLIGGLVRGSRAFRLIGAPVRFVIGAVRSVGTAFGRLPGKLGGAAGKAAHAVLSRMGRIVSGLARIGGRAARAVIGGLLTLPGRIAGLAGRVAGGAAKLGRGIVNAIVNAIKSAPKAITGAVLSIIPGPIRSLVTKAGGALRSLFGGRTGGRVSPTGFKRFQDGGLVPILASGGEQLVDGGHAMTIPGRDDRDGTLMLARPGAAVLTYDGQARVAAGAPLSQAISAQAPHFAEGGVVSAFRSAIQRRKAGPKPSLALWMAGIVESGLRNLNRGDRDSKGPLQVRVGIHGEKLAMNPLASALRFLSRGFWGKGGAISLAKRNPRRSAGWVAQNTQGSAYPDRYDKVRGQALRYLKSAAGTATTAATTGTTGTTAAKGNRPLGRDRFRGGLTSDAFSQGQQAGQAGLTRALIKREGNPIIAALRETATSATDSVSATASASAGSSARRREPAVRRRTGNANVKGAKPGFGPLVAFFRQMFGKGIYVMSGMRPGSRVAGSGNVSNHATGDAVDLTHKGIEGASSSRPPRGTGAARMDRLHSYIGRAIKRPPRRDFLWRTMQGGNHFNHIHMGMDPAVTRTIAAGRRFVSRLPGMRAGGIVGRSRAGGQVGRPLASGLDRALTMAGGTLEALDETIGRSAQERLGAFREQILRGVRKGGPRKTIERLQSVVDLIDFELGRRVGRIQDEVEQRTAGIDRGRGIVDRSMRLMGIAQESSAGLGVLSTAQAAETRVRQQNVASLTSALAKATKAKNRESIREITGQLNDAHDELQESFVKQIELARDAIRSAAQEHVDLAAHRSTLVSEGMRSVELYQKLTGTYDAAGSAQTRADLIKQYVVPQLQAEVNALGQQYAAAKAIGDEQLARQIAEATFARQNDVWQSMLEAQEMTAENTNALKEFGGSIAFSHRDQLYTDMDVVKARIGA